MLSLPDTHKSLQIRIYVALLVASVGVILASGMAAAKPLLVDEDHVVFPTEVGRIYTIETSTDLDRWIAEPGVVTGSGYSHRHRLPHRKDGTFFVRVCSEAFENEVDFALRERAAIASGADAATVTAFDEATGEMTVSRSNWPHKVGDVVVLPPCAGAPNGLLVRLTSAVAHADGESTVFGTEPAAVADLLSHGKFRFRQALTAENAGQPELLFALGASAGRAGRANEGDLTANAEGGTFIISADDLVLLDSEDGKLILDGAIELHNPSLEFFGETEGEDDGLFMKTYGVTVTPSVETTLELRGTVDLHEEKIWELVNIPFGTFQVGPFIFTPALRIYIGASMDVDGSFICNISQQKTMTLGMTYNFTEGWDTIADVSSDSRNLVIDASAQLYAEMFAGVAAEVALYNATGPYFGIEGFFALDADTDLIGTDDPWWTLEAGHRFVFGFDAQFLGLGDTYHKTIGGTSVEVMDSNDEYSRETVSSDSANYWATGITGGGIDEIYSVREVSGGVIAAGHTTSYSDIPDAHYAGWLVKYDRGGGVTWQRSLWLQDPDHEDRYLQLKEVIAEPLPNGGYAIAGSWAADGAPTQPFLMAMDEDGTVAFAKRYEPIPGTRRSSAEQIRVLANGSIILLVEYRMDSNTDGTEERYTGLLSVSTDGTVQWQQLLQSPADPHTGELRNTEPNALATAPDGSLVVLSHVEGSSSASSAAKLVTRISSKGTVQSAKVYDSDGALGSFHPAGHCAVTEDGQIVFSDWTKVVWLNEDGSVAWAKHHNLVTIEAMATDGANVIVAGELFGAGAWMATLASDGTMPLSRTYTRPANNRYLASGITASENGGYVLGLREWGGFNASEFWVVRTAEEGVIAFDPGSGADADFGAVTSRDGSVSVSSTEVTVTPLLSENLATLDATVLVQATDAPAIRWARAE